MVTMTIIALLILIVIIVPSVLCERVETGYVVRRLSDGEAVAVFKTHWEAEQWLDEITETSDVRYYLDD